MPITRSQFRESVAVRNELVADRIRLSALKSDLKVIDIKNISVPKAREAGAALFVYEYSVHYDLEEPKNQSLGKIVIKGEIVYVETAKIVEDVLSDWKKDKKIKPAILQEVLNSALRDAQIEALEQSKKVMLPAPIPLPKIKTKTSKAS